MSVGELGDLELFEPFRTPYREFSSKVRQLIFELAVRNWDGHLLGRRADLGLVEAIIPSKRLIEQAVQIEVDGRDRVSLRLKSLKLRMPLIASRFASQHRLRKQRLAPAGDKSLAVEILRVQ